MISEKRAIFPVFFDAIALRWGAEAFASAARGHWGIEKHLHWQMDVSFGEDANRTREGHGPENLSLVRRIAAFLLKKEKTTKAGVKAKRKKAGWDDDYLAKVLDGQLDESFFQEQ